MGSNVRVYRRGLSTWSVERLSLHISATDLLYDEERVAAFTGSIMINMLESVDSDRNPNGLFNNDVRVAIGEYLNAFYSFSMAQDAADPDPKWYILRMSNTPVDETEDSELNVLITTWCERNCGDVANKLETTIVMSRETESIVNRILTDEVMWNLLIRFHE